MTLHLDDARWRTASTARLLDEPHGVDPQWLDDYAPHDAEIAAEKALLDALARPESDVEIDDEAVIAGALEQWEQPELGSPSPRRRWATRAAVATGLLAAGLAAGLLLGIELRVPEVPRDDAHVARVDAVPAPPAEASEAPEVVTPPEPPASPTLPGDAPIPERTEWTVRTGGVGSKTSEDPSASLPQATPLVAAGRLCASSTPDNELCLDDGSRFEVVDGDRLQLLQGRIHVQSRKGQAPTLQAGDMRIEARGPTSYVVEYEVAGWSLTVEDGAPVVHTAQTHTTVLAGQTLMGNEAQRRPKRATPDPRSRLAEARAARAAGDREGAAHIYEALIAASPRSPLARVATVSLGQLYLELKRPKKARAAFERYLARGPGPLSEDAAFGRLRALRALDSPTLGPAIEKFLARYPDGAYAPRVRRWSD